VYYKCSSNSRNPLRRQSTVEKSAAVPLTNFGWRSGAPHLFLAAAARILSGWHGGRIRRLTGLQPLQLPKQ